MQWEICITDTFPKGHLTVTRRKGYIANNQHIFPSNLTILRPMDFSVLFKQLCVWFFGLHVHMFCALHVCWMCTDIRRGSWITWNWSQSWATRWVLGVGPRSQQELPTLLTVQPSLLLQISVLLFPQQRMCNYKMCFLKRFPWQSNNRSIDLFMCFLYTVHPCFLSTSLKFWKKLRL